MNNNYKRIQAIDIDTGEVLGTTYMKANGSEEIILKSEKKRNLTPEQKMFLNERNEFRNHCKELGGYVHMIYAKNELLFNSLGIDKANISRIIYLATYSDYNQKGLIVQQNRDEYGKYLSNEPMTRKQIQTILKLGDTAFKSFLKDMKNNNLMFELDKAFFVNTQYFIKGEVENIDNTKQSYCRLFINTIRELYEGCKVTKHKILANVFQLIPFVHYEYNIICHNPNDSINSPKALTLSEICELLQVDYSHSSRLAKQLYEFKVTVKGVEYHLFSYIVLNANYDYFVVNPLVIYSGNSLESVENTSKALFFNEYTHRQKRK